jgi:hypothetical protein
MAPSNRRDPDQDLLNKLDAREAWDDLVPIILQIVAGAAIGACVFLVMRYDASISGEVSADAGVLAGILVVLALRLRKS